MALAKFTIDDEDVSASLSSSSIVNRSRQADLAMAKYKINDDDNEVVEGPRVVCCFLLKNMSKLLFFNKKQRTTSGSSTTSLTSSSVVYLAMASAAWRDRFLREIIIVMVGGNGLRYSYGNDSFQYKFDIILPLQNKHGQIFF
eukprot:scaffold192276_cov48-Attheya_sp.AAC.1